MSNFNKLFSPEKTQGKKGKKEKIQIPFRKMWGKQFDRKRKHVRCPSGVVTSM
jgi:hypothetical protein